MLKKVSILKLYMTIKKVLTIRQYRTRTEGSIKNEDCPKTTLKLAPVETTEPVTEVVSNKTADLSSTESNYCVLTNIMESNYGVK